MAASPRRRSLIGRSGPPGSEPPSRADTLPPGGTSTDVEVVEHEVKDTFKRSAAQDSYAMDEPQSEEVGLHSEEVESPSDKVDPRFARAMNGVEPVTEMLDRRWLADIADGERTMTEEELADIDLAKLARPRAVEQASKSDLATERVDPKLLTAALLNTSSVGEMTVPASLPDTLLEIDEEPPKPGAFELTLPAPQQASPDDTNFMVIAPLRASNAPEPAATPLVQRHTPSASPAPPRTEAPLRDERPLPPPSTPEPSPHAPSSALVTLTDASRPRSATPAHAARSESAPITDAVPLPLVGLVVAGSGGVVALVITVVVAVVVMSLIIWLAGGEPATPLPLPPIEVREAQPGEDNPKAQIPTEAPQETTEEPPEGPSHPRPKRLQPDPIPEPVLIPAPPPAPEPEELPDDLDLQPEPEPEKRGLFKKKK